MGVDMSQLSRLELDNSSLLFFHLTPQTVQPVPAQHLIDPRWRRRLLTQFPSQYIHNLIPIQPLMSLLDYSLFDLGQYPPRLPARTSLPGQQIIFISALQIPVIVLPECPAIQGMRAVEFLDKSV